MTGPATRPPPASPAADPAGPASGGPGAGGSVSELVDALAAHGVELWAEAGQLRYRAPRGVLTGPWLAALRERKPELLAYLRRAESAVITADPAATHQPFPLTDIQLSYLLGRRSAFAYSGVGCHAYGELTFPDLDGERVTSVWRALVARHPMLRAVIDPAGSQRILPDPPPLQVAVRDLRGRNPGEVAAAVAEVRAELDHRVYQPDRWPLFTVAVTRSDQAAVLHLSIDFLIADYPSIQLLLDEFATRYQDPEHPLPELEITFRDYLLGERRLRETRRYEQDRGYWWGRIDALPAAPDLPVRGDRAATGSGQVRFRRWALQLPAGGYQRLRQAAGAVGITPSVALLAAYAEVIGRWSRRPRFTLNLTLLRRLPLHPQVDRLIGDFTSALPLAVDWPEPASFAQRARRLQQRLWEGLDHPLVSGVEVLRELARRRGKDAALMPVVFTSAVGLGAVREPAPVPGAGPASGRPPGSSDGRPPGSSDGRPPASRDGRPPGDPGISQTPQVWIDCQALERAGGLVINWDVRQGVFPDGLVDDMFRAFEELVRELAAGRRWEAADPVPLPERQLARRRAVNATAVPRPAGRLPDRVVQQCRRTPDRPAVLTRTGSLTYRELLARAGALAAAVRAAGGQHRDLVAVLLPTGPEQVVAVLGILLAGCAYLPVDTRAPAARRAAMLADAGVRLAVVSAATPEPLPVPAVRVDQLPGGPAPEPDPAGPADPAYVIYTSGSTGRPKGVVIPHRGALNTVQDITARFGVGPEDRVLGLASLSFDLSVYDIFGPLAVGGALVLPDPDRRGDPSHWAELVGTHQVTVWNSVPVQLQMLADYLRGEPELALPSLRLAMLSGDWIPVGLPDQIRSRLPDLVVHSLGGATEASIWSVGFPIDRVRPEWTSIPYGRPLANQTCQVLDQAMRPCPDWAVGELYLGGAGLADGYLGDPALTAQRFVPDPVTGERLYRTGDLCRYLPTGDLELLGREDRQVKIRGHRIELAEIEAALQAYPSVGGAAVVVEGEGALERRLAGFVEPASRADDPAPELPEAVSAAARAELARIRATQDGARAVGFARQLDRTALLAMVTALRQAGLFGSAQTSHTVPEVLAAAGVAPRHARLIRRWVQALERHGMLVRDPVTGRLRASPSALAVGPATVAAAWRRVDALLPEGGQRPELVDYFRTASQHLPELMRDQLDPVQLLFPQGRPDIQESAYRDNFLSDTLNRIVVAAVRELARRWPAARPLRVLEVGAGVGGTSSDLIPALAGFPVEYRFTDVSQYFLHLARDRFAAYPWVSYQRFDLNQDYRSQGLTPNRLDLVLCANVLHYARHAGQAVARLRELLGPGGWLVFVETTRDNYQILTSMEFLFDATAGDFEDVRAGRDQTFLSVRQWRELLAGAGARPAVLLTEPDQALDRIGMHVFAARFKPDRVPVELADLRRHLADRLPDYLLPARLEVLDGLPLTGNGKVDRARLDQLLATPAGSAGGAGGGSAEPSGPLEAAVAAVWAGLLPAARVGRDDDLFRLGGDSLVAAQLVGRLREEVPEAAGATFDQLLRELLEGATVASLAATLAGATGPGAAAAGAPGPDVAAPGAAAGAVPAGAGPADSGPPGGRLLPAGPVGPGAGTGPVRLLLPDGTGEPPAVPGWPPAGPPPVRAVLPDPDRFERLDPAVLVQTLAEQYVRELAGRFPARPVALAGQDLGGVLAHEVARQWAEAGHPVRELTVVAATPLPGRPDRPGDLLAGYLFARALGVAAPDLGLPPEPELAGRLEAGDGQVLTPLAAEPEDWRVARIASLIDTDPAELAARYRVFRHGLAALAGHRPLPYAGDLTLVVGFDPGYWPATAAAVEARWRASCLGEFRVVHRIGSRP